MLCEAGQFRWAVGWAWSCASTLFSASCCRLRRDSRCGWLAARPGTFSGAGGGGGGARDGAAAGGGLAGPAPAGDPAAAPRRALRLCGSGEPGECQPGRAVCHCAGGTAGQLEPRRWCWPPFPGRKRIHQSGDSPLAYPAHLLCSMVWMQAFLAMLHLLPAYPLDCGRLLRGSFAAQQGFAPGRARPPA